MSLIGYKAPVFSAPAIVNGKQLVENFSLQQYIDNKYVVLFFYPADFSFVCPTEFFAFQKKLSEFDKREVVIVGCSVDSHITHQKWLNIEKKYGGIKGITFPLISDQTHTISENYGVFAGQFNYSEDGQAIFTGIPVAQRGLFIIDKAGILRHLSINDFPLGRNIDEIIRIIDAQIFTEKNDAVCPANWQKGDKGLQATQKGIEDYFEEVKS